MDILVNDDKLTNALFCVETAFKKKFSKSKEILKTSKEFVLVNILAVSDDICNFHLL